MNTQTDRAKEIFLDALEIADAADRLAFLDDACAVDPALRAEIDTLLAHHEQAGSFLATVPRDPNATAGLDVGTVESPGTLVGPYRLLEQIGEGGMGQVFVAEQSDPVRRKVALKVIKPGMDTREVVGRFEAERQALALMDHPNIARVLDGGATVSGRPYFVMELVRGVSVTEYCDRHYLSVRTRLELFVQVCQAIQHAHTKGIIHRDIKPSNVLVTEHDGKPVAKVIDFGVAKSVGVHLTDKTIYTQFRQLIGTPLYMSPEQASLSGQDIDTRSDIYSLGVLLYELLTGTTPFDRERFRNAGYDELRRIIREEEPARPSARLSTLAAAATTASANRSTDPRRLTRLVRGELDWLVMKALEKDRNRRYETCAAFASDVQHFLADEPVLACSPSASYRLRKFVRRNKVILATTAVIALALVAAFGTIGWTLFERHERQLQELKARHERRQRGADEITRSVTEGRKLQVARRWPESLVLARHAREVLERTEDQDELRPSVEELLRDVEMIRSLEGIDLRKADASTGLGLGFTNPAAEYHPVFKNYDIDVLALEIDDAAQKVRDSPIRDYLVEALDSWLRMEPDKPTRERLRATVQKIDPEGTLAQWRMALERNDPAELRRFVAGLEVGRMSPATLAVVGGGLTERRLHKEAVEWLRVAHRHYPEDFWINFRLASAHAQSDPPQWVEVLRHFTAALTLRPRSHMIYSNIGVALRLLGRRDEALAAYKKALELKPDYAHAHSNIGFLLAKDGKCDQAEASLRQAIAHQPNHAMAYRNLALVYMKTKRTKQALAFIDQALKYNPDLAEAYSLRGVIWLEAKELDKATADFHLALKHNDKLAEAFHGLGRMNEERKQYSEAVKWYETAIRHDPEAMETHYRLGVTYSHWGRHEARNGATKVSTELFDKAIAKLNDAIKMDKDFAEAWYSLGNASRDRGQIRVAIAAFEKAAAMKAKSDDGEYRPHFNLANVYARLGEFPKAVEALRAAIKADPDFVRPHISLAATLAEQGDFAGSEKAAANALERDKHNPEAIVNFAVALDRQGRYAEALAFLRRVLEKFVGSPAERDRLVGLVRLYEQFVPLQKQLPAFLSGKKNPTDAEVRLILGEICIATQDYAAAARFYRGVFQEYPHVADNLGSGYRIDGARAAACAGSRLDKVAALTADQEVQWRKQALEWLRADVRLWARNVERKGPIPDPTVVLTLQRWRHHTHFASVRGGAIDKLPADERADWRKLWADVDMLLAKVEVP